MTESIARLKISLLDTDPAIWRRVEVLADLTLEALHAVIQSAMGWTNSHLHQFEVGRKVIAGPGAGAIGFAEARPESTRRVRLSGLVAGGVKRFRYIYDMGDDWQHEVRIEKVLAADPAAAYPRFVDGAGRCPPEDVGGLPGFYDFLDAMAQPEHLDHDELADWYGGPFDPADMDEAGIRSRLKRLASRSARPASRPKRPR